MTNSTIPSTLHIETFEVGPLSNNLYILRDDASKQFVVVDPSLDSQNALNRVLELTRDGYTFSAIWNTHGHFDHIYDNALWKSQFDVPVVMHRDDEWLLERLPDTAVMLLGLPEVPIIIPTAWLHEGQTLKVGDLECEVLLLPGHSPGSVAFYFAQENVCIAGDVLFKGSVGRTDIPGSDGEILRRSLAKLCALPDNTRILPGHGAPTSLAQEKATNPFCQNLSSA